MSTPLAMASRMRTLTDTPSCPKLSAIASRFWTKKTVARKIKAGKAILESTLCIFSAALPHFFLTAMPTTMGRNMSTMFCMKSLPTGSCTWVWLPTAVVAQSIMRGTVKRVIMLLHAVSDTESATSPRASIENTFDELPPGQQAMSTKPMRNNGSRPNARPISHASNGNTTICPTKPAITGLGRSRKSLKSSIFKFKPSSNIKSVKMGNTIQIVFILLLIVYTKKILIPTTVNDN